jgi:hypothetical protein
LDANITTDKLADSSVTNAKFKDNSINTIKITDSAITTNKIKNLNVTTTKLADSAVTTTKLRNLNVTTEKIANDAVTTIKILDANVTTAKILDANVTTAKIANDAVTTLKIADANVTTAKILDANVTTAKIANDAVTTVKILDANVTTAKILDANVTTAKIANDAVTTVKILDANVTTAKILDANVTTAKIADDAVTTIKIADANVTTSKITDLNVTTAKLAENAVTTNKILDANITTSKIADNAVTNVKILSVDQSKITGIILGAIGGTGVANTGKTITLGGNLTTSGAFATTLVSTAATNVTLPTIGTLATLAGTETFTNKTITASSNTITGLTNTNLSGNAGITIANGGTGANTVIGAKTNLILDQVDNTRDLNKPISTATQAALDLKAPLASPNLTGIPTAPTAAFATNTTQIATTEFVMANASTLDATTTTKGKLKLAGDLTGTADLPLVAPGAIDNSKISPTAAIADTKLETISSIGKVLNSATTATNSNSINSIVLRDGTGNFSAGTITATLSGNATNVSGIVLGVNGGTGIANTGKTITLDGNLTTSGAFATTLVSTAATNVTLPTTGTLATLDGTETFTNKRIAASSNTISGLTNNNLSGSAGISIANGGTGASTVIGIKTNLILDLVDNTTDLNKPISTATQTALDLKAPLASPSLTGVPLAPTASLATSTTQIATTEFVMANAFTPDATTTTKGRIQLAGDLTGTADLPLIANDAINNSKIANDAEIEDKKLATIVTDGKVANSATSATSANTNSAIVARDGSGNFSAGTITANLTGNVSGNAENVTGIVLGANGGTGIDNTGRTIKLGGNLITSGAYTTTLVSIATTSVTLPTTGILATRNGVETLTGKTIAAGTNTITGLTNNNLSNSAGITAIKLASNSIITEKIENEAVTEDKIAPNAVSTFKIKDAAVTSAKILTDAVTSTKIKDFNIIESKIKDEAVTSTKIAIDAVIEEKIKNEAVTVNKIAIDAVTAEKIASNAVTENKIENEAVTEDKIALNAVSEFKIADNAVITTKIKNYNITLQKIQKITPNKILGNMDGTGIIEQISVSGDGEVVLSNAATLTNANLGTPSSIDLTYATNIPISKNKVKGKLEVENGGTGTDSLFGILKGNGKNKINSAVEGIDYSLVREVEDQFYPSQNDSIFTLTRQPNVKSKVKMFINGIKSFKNSVVLNGTTATYIKSNNKNYAIKNDDIVEFVYYY